MRPCRLWFPMIIVERGLQMSSDAPLMRILSTEGVVEVEVGDRDERSLVIAHWHAIDRVREGDTSKIGDYAGKRAAEHELEADPKTITRWAKQDDLDFEDIYASR